jgi:DNA-binding NarL/FixJ family response regulator
MKEKIYVHVADDHKILIEGIIAVINTDKDIEIKGYSLTGKEVIDWFSKKENNADILILDISMPILDGFQVLKYFKKNKIDQKVIVLSSYDDSRIVQEVLSLGCKGYISKNEAGEHILRAVKSVSKGEQYYSTDIQSILLKSLSGEIVTKGEIPDKFRIDSLTERELDVLKLIMKEYSSLQIAERMFLSVYTIETYRKSLLKKLNVKNSVGLAMYAYKNKII